MVKGNIMIGHEFGDIRSQPLAVLLRGRDISTYYLFAWSQDPVKQYVTSPLVVRDIGTNQSMIPASWYTSHDYMVAKEEPNFLG